MTHAEYLYLLGVADITRRASEQAEREGETFHPSAPYSTLTSGLGAAAWFERGKLVLRLRHPTSDPGRWLPVVALAFHAFFPSGCDLSQPVQEGAWTLHQGTANA